jgi:hypothetical protein
LTLTDIAAGGDDGTTGDAVGVEGKQDGDTVLRQKGFEALAAGTYA